MIFYIISFYDIILMKSHIVMEVIMKKKFIFCSLFLLLIMPVVSIFINNYSKVSADGQYTVSYKSVDGQIAGTFQFIDTFVEKSLVMVLIQTTTLMLMVGYRKVIMLKLFVIHKILVPINNLKFLVWKF